MSNEARYQQAACMGKAARTKVDAERVAKWMWRQDKGRITAYRCVFCRQWHVGERSDA